ncbi:putative choline sulfate-utilization transcription factor [Pseudomonas duriflava]|uniref:Putative choline sulfate-utilization transcription factor n=1 Tax=Pseudomonas duriflava TaxID=459528 RepID=A0A562QLF2_9PSED|nr:LysR family transcriptional regulator [Pseudomonas duriflava]TWI57554.1 putative choline sulfate-utilization transcription factor [Pseudomonas duriflava]
MALADEPLSLDSLRVFEAAARHLSFTAAAAELGTTQPAVSQQIKRLERQLSVRLFDRVYRGIVLTESGALLLDYVQTGLESIDSGIAAITQRSPHEVLKVATDFAFAAYWLMPRLPRFHEANPDLDVSLITGDRALGLARQDIDVTLTFSDGRFKHGDALALFREEVFPVCSPRLVKEMALPLPRQALASLPMLHLKPGVNSHWFDWKGLFQALNIQAPPIPAVLSFDNYTLVIQAAIAGQGVAIGWRHLVDDLLHQGLLCRPIQESATSAYGYYALLPERKRRGRLIERFVGWLHDELNGRGAEIERIKLGI